MTKPALTDPSESSAKFRSRSGADGRLDFEIGIIGAGFSGLVAGLELLSSGRTSFSIFEQAAEVGGVWRDNVYPGCASDVRAALYSMANWPNPHWRGVYAGQPEILDYLKTVARDAGLERHLHLGAEIVEARFEEDTGCWQLRFRDGHLVRVRTLILATGPHNRPFTPALPGLSRFAGGVTHSARWPAELDLTDLRVAVVGSGASAVQIVPNLAGRAAHLTVLQRSAPWVLPRGDRRTTRMERWLHLRAPWTLRLRRAAIYWLMELVGTAFFGAKPMQRLLERVALQHLRRQVIDQRTRRALTPDYSIGCKRITVSDEFYLAFNRANVTLTTSPIADIQPDGIRTADGVLHNVDHIVMATGFVVAEAAGFLRVVGCGGRILEEVWVNGPEAYLGLTIAGFPNLAMLLGPNSGLGHSSVIHVVESQMRYVLQYLASLDAAGPETFLDARPAVQEIYNREVQAMLARTVWNSGCQSWYLTGAGRNTTIFPGLAHDYRKRTAQFDTRDYQVGRALGDTSTHAG